MQTSYLPLRMRVPSLGWGTLSLIESRMLQSCCKDSSSCCVAFERHETPLVDDELTRAHDGNPVEILSLLPMLVITMCHKEWDSRTEMKGGRFEKGKENGQCCLDRQVSTDKRLKVGEDWRRHKHDKLRRRRGGSSMGIRVIPAGTSRRERN